MKKLPLLFFLCVFLSSCLFARADTGTVREASLAMKSYTYNYWLKPVECPDPYTISKTVTGVDLSIGNIKKLNDVFADGSGDIFIAASGDSAGDNRLIKLDRNLNVLKVWHGYTDKKGKQVAFKEPLGVFVTSDNDIYLADGNSKKIYEMDSGGRLIRVINAPSNQDNSIITSDFAERYRPSKIVVDSTGHIFVVAININEGIIEFDRDGKFDGFLAAGKVNANAAEILWKKLSTKAQLSRMSDFVPIEYNNITLDKEDFVFASCASVDSSLVEQEIRSGQATEQGALVRRLNMLGNNILSSKGFGAPVGDYDVLNTTGDMNASYKGVSTITDISCGDDGTFSILDNNRCRIFTYDSDGSLLYAFGGPDVTSGGFRTPVSMAQWGNFLYVLDNGTHAVTMFKRTTFGDDIAAATAAREKGDYHASSKYWKSVLNKDANYDLAYTGIGKTCYQDSDYKTAMHYFKLGSNRSWYSKAYKEYRKAIVAKWFAPFAVTVVAVMALVILIHRLRTVWTKRNKVGKPQ